MEATEATRSLALKSAVENGMARMKVWLFFATKTVAGEAEGL
jgi:hypothetical protein